MGTMRRILFLAAGAAALAAQQGSVSGPVAGYVFDAPARALRPVVGIPGAAYIGTALDAGWPIANAWIAPRQDVAAALAQDGSLHFFRLDAGRVSELPAGDVAGTPESVAFSPSGTAAALVFGGQAQLVTGLPDAPRRAALLDLAQARRSGEPGRRSVPARETLSMAVSDDGTLLLVGGGSQVRIFDAGGGSRTILESAGGALVAFAPGGHDGAAAASDGGVVMFRDLAGAAERQALGTVPSPSGLAFASDAVLVASPSGVVRLDLSGGARNEIACRCAPSGLVPMGAVFRLNEAGQGPLWLLDGARTVFVPAAGPSEGH